MLGKRGEDSQSAMHQFDENSGVMFYSQVAINGIACWNSAKPFSVENHAVIAMDNTRMIYPADLSVSNSRKKKFQFIIDIKMTCLGGQ